MKTSKKPKQKAFTLIELLIVIAIIGLLASIVLTATSKARMQARDAKRIGDLQQISTALELYYADNGSYPPSNGCGYDCNGYSYSFDSSWTNLQTFLQPYMATLPKDPVNNGCAPWSAGCLSYSYGNVGNSTYKAQYDLTAQLEIPNHPLSCAIKQYRFYFNGSQLWCGSYSAQIYEASPN